MNYINKIVKITLLPAVVFSFIGCDDGACCTSSTSNTKTTGYIVPDGVLKKEDIEKPKIQLVHKGNLETKNDPEPLPPVAVIYTNEHDLDIATTSKCKPVEFSGKGSYDDQSEDLQYNWTDLHGNHMSSDEEFKHKFSKKGLYEVTLTVTDKDNLTAVDKVCILSGLEDIPLLADAGADITATKDETVTLSGRAVCRDDIASYEWKEGDIILSEKPTFSTSELPVGEHTLKLIVTDFSGKRTYDKVKVTIK